MQIRSKVIIIIMSTLFTLTACGKSSEDKGVSNMESTTSSSENKTAEVYTVTVDEDATNEQILITMDPSLEQNRDNTALGEGAFNGYLLVESLSVMGENEEKIEASTLKKGDQLELTLEPPVIMAKSFPPKIAGNSIKKIVRITQN